MKKEKEEAKAMRWNGIELRKNILCYIETTPNVIFPYTIFLKANAVAIHVTSAAV